MRCLLTSPQPALAPTKLTISKFLLLYTIHVYTSLCHNTLKQFLIWSRWSAAVTSEVSSVEVSYYYFLPVKLAAVMSEVSSVEVNHYYFLPVQLPVWCLRAFPTTSSCSFFPVLRLSCVMFLRRRLLLSISHWWSVFCLSSCSLSISVAG